MGGVFSGTANESTIKAAVLPITVILSYMVFVLWSILKIRKEIPIDKKNSFLSIIFLIIVIMFILFGYQVSRQVRVGERIANECHEEGSDCEDKPPEKTSDQNHEVKSPWSNKNPKGLNSWEITWGLFRMALLFTVLIIYISKKMISEAADAKTILQMAFPDEKKFFQGIALQIFNPENLAFMFLIYILISAFIMRSTYLNDQLNFDKVDSSDVNKGGSRIVKAEADYSLLVIIGAPFLALALGFAYKDEIRNDGEWGTGAVKIVIFFVIYIICMISLEMNRKKSKSWGPLGLPWFQGAKNAGLRVYPNPDTYVINLGGQTLEDGGETGIQEIKADNIETIVRALQVANESCQARDSTKQEDVDTCEGVEISGTGDEARRSSCENNAECVYVAR